MFHGSMVALITPMHEDGAVDFAGLERLVEWHIKQGTQGIVAMGTTGEAATLTEAEQQEVIRFVVAQVNKRVPVIAGTGTNSTAVTIERTKAAQKLGVDGCLIVTPYYNKPTQEGLYSHYKTIAERVPVPIILYNVPGRTAVDLLPETADRLALIPNIVGIKEAVGTPERIKSLVACCGERLDILSGDDLTGLDLILQGGKGVISVTANIAPKAMSRLCQLALAGQEAEAKALQDQLLPLHQALFVESNPIPIKWALADRDSKIGAGIRLPLTPLAASYHAEVRVVVTSVLDNVKEVE